MNTQSEITIVFEDDDILVINKPAGITVNKADTTKGEQTVQDWSEEYLQMPKQSGGPDWKLPAGANADPKQRPRLEATSGGQWQIEEGNDFLNRGGIVHRLDKETSGILLLAKNPESFVELQRQFKERIVKKTYRALAHGKVIPGEGEINVPVGRLPWNRRQFGVVAGGREALTRYKVLWTKMNPVIKEELSYVELYPETGRTHQIRVHLKYIGHPIFADFLYAGRKIQRDDRKLLSRVFLHAAKLSLQHPRTHEQCTYEAPLPQELQQVLDEM
jgi:RluA family pseudouridine synthase